MHEILKTNSHNHSSIFILYLLFKSYYIILNSFIMRNFDNIKDISEYYH